MEAPLQADQAPGDRSGDRPCCNRRYWPVFVHIWVTSTTRPPAATPGHAPFGDHTTAVLMYEAETVPVKNAPGAECLTVQDGKITHIRIVFDRAPLDAARTAAPAAKSTTL